MAISRSAAEEHTTAAWLHVTGRLVDTHLYSGEACGIYQNTPQPGDPSRSVVED